MVNIDYDIVIAGGGIVGCAAALALSNATDYSIAVIEAFEPAPAKSNHAKSFQKNSSQENAFKENVATQKQHPSFDARVVALAKESFQLLQQFGLQVSDLGDKNGSSVGYKGSQDDSHTGSLQYCPIKHIHVSDRGHLGQVQLRRQNEYEQDKDQKQSLGYVVSLAELGQKVLDQLGHTNVDYLCPEQIVAVARYAEYTQLQLSTSKINTKLVLIAEGGQSPSRELFGLNASVEDYEQSAIIANVITQLPHEYRAFERFTSQGPIALLPMQTDAGNQLSLVWTANRQKAAHIAALNDSEFLNQLQSLFGDKLGRFEAASSRFAYPLFLSRVNEFTGHRVLCLGNAAQSLHPIAGQGFNLGVRDIQGLVKVLAQAKQSTSDLDPGSFPITHAYKKERWQDKNDVINATDALVKVFSNQYIPFTVARNLSLIALNLSPSLKNTLASFAMGER